METRGPWELAGEDADALLVGVELYLHNSARFLLALSPPAEKGARGDMSSLLGHHRLSCPLESVCTDCRTTDAPSFVTFLFFSVLTSYIITCQANHTPFILGSASRRPAGCASTQGRATLDWGQGAPCGFPPLHSLTTRTQATGLGEALVVKGCLD